MVEPKLLEKKIRFRFKENTPNGILLEYLSNHPDKKCEELIWEALRMLFMPLAYLHAGETNEKYMYELTMSSLLVCLNHWNLVQLKLNLDLPLEKIILNHLASLSRDINVTNTVMPLVGDKIPVEQIVRNNIQDNLSQETDEDDDSWYDNVQVQFELSEEQKAYRREIDSLL